MPPKRRYQDDYDEGYPQFLNQRVCKPRKYVIYSCCKCKTDRNVNTRYCPHCGTRRCRKCNYMEAEHTNVVWDKACYEQDHGYDSRSDHESDEENEEHRSPLKRRVTHQKKHEKGGTLNEGEKSKSDGTENEGENVGGKRSGASTEKEKPVAREEASDSEDL